MRLQYLCLSLVVAVPTVTSSSASFSATFTDRSLFNANATITLSEDFQSLGNTTVGIPGPVTMPSGIVISSQSNSLFVAGPGQSTNPTTAIGSALPTTDSLFVALGADYTAFGADMFQNRGGGAQQSDPLDNIVNLFENATLVASFTASVAPNGGSFFGVTSNQAFNKVEILSTVESFEVIDNVVAGTQIAATPLPAAFPLFTMGVGTLGMLGWRRKRTSIKTAR